jgi:membrane associated rhomboid family serine protease
MIPLRDENPTQTFSFITVALIILNSVIFIYELSLGSFLDTVIRRFTIIPYDFVNHLNFSQLFSLISSMFLHGGFLHLAGNMLYLWIFGNNIEDVLGHFKFLIYYLVCGILASLVHIFTNPQSTLPTIGASGAVSGMLGAYFILFPRAKVLTLMPLFYFYRIVRIPAFFFLGFWILFQFMFGMTVSSMGEISKEGGVAWFAHIGGFFAGILFLPIFYRRRKRKKVF